MVKMNILVFEQEKHGEKTTYNLLDSNDYVNGINTISKKNINTYNLTRKALADANLTLIDMPLKKMHLEPMSKDDDIIKNGQVTKEILDTHLIKITFFQHERLIHLLVTLFYAIFTLAFLALGTIHYIFFIIFLILIIFLIFYIFHYFFLENSVQYLYKQYDILKHSLK